jgi:hypothetical protein
MSKNEEASDPAGGCESGQIAQRIEPGCVKGGCNDCGLCGMRSPRATKRKAPTISAADKKKLSNLLPGIKLD